MRNVSTRNIQNATSFWFYLQDSLYHLAFTQNDYKINQVRFDSSSLDFARSQPFYTPAKKKTAIFSSNALTSFSPVYGILFLAVGVVFGRWLFRKKSPEAAGEQMPGQTSAEPETVPFYKNLEFRTSLNPVEIEFLIELYNHSAEGKKMPASIINKLLGVSGKDPEIQKARRSNAITRINKLYSGLSGHEVTLIDRIRDPNDKRSYLYFIEPEHLARLDALLKTDGQDLI